MKNEILVKKLIKKAKNNGHIRIDDIIDCAIEFNNSLDEIDIISEKLLRLGIIIRDDNINGSENDVEYIDKSKIDYDELFDKALNVEPNLINFIEYLRQVIPPQNNELDSLIYQAKAGNKFAINRITDMYSRLVVKYALFYHEKYFFDISDSIQEGLLSILKAIEMYNPSKSAFSSYLTLWIRQYIFRASNTINPCYRYPEYIKSNFFSLYEVIIDHYCEKCYGNIYCPNLTNKIKNKLMCNNEEARWYIDELNGYYSLEDLLENNEEIFNDKGLCEYSLINKIEKSEMKEKVNELLTKLKDRDKGIIKKRFGFNDYEEMTLQEIGDHFDLTRERIRQIEKKSLRRMKHRIIHKEMFKFLKQNL